MTVTHRYLHEQYQWYEATVIGITLSQAVEKFSKLADCEAHGFCLLINQLYDILWLQCLTQYSDQFLSRNPDFADFEVYVCEIKHSILARSLCIKFIHY